MLNNFFSYQPVAALLAEPDVLAALEFNQDAVAGAVPVRLDVLGFDGEGAEQYREHGGGQNIVEVWQSPSERIEHGQHGECQWRRSRNFQFVSVSSLLDISLPIQEVTEHVYKSLLQTISNSEHPQLLRFWNIIPRINQGDGDHENYRRFCSGRLAAFNSFAIEPSHFPAASAVGHYADGLTVYALSTRHKPIHLTNPRQVNAYNYPRQYGPTSPSFARATRLEIDAGGDGTATRELCFISGTASILGHNTVHKEDLLAQLHTTNDNILYLLKEAGRKRREIRSMRVYLRNPQDYPVVSEIVRGWYPSASIVFTHADICRLELLVEIECFCVAD